MTEVVAKSTQYLTDQDLMAIAEYLKSLPPATNQEEDTEDFAMQASDASAATHALRAGDTALRGSQVYLDNCNACHRSDGSGAERTFPNLAKNKTVNAHDPVSLIHLVLAGSAMPSTQTAPSAITMPDFGWRLSDGDVAEVLSFVRSSWGNHAAEVNSDEVGRVRRNLAVQKKAE